jgi:A/G-specific adenine glycosylase
MTSFAPRLVAWQRVHGRHDLPWQGQDAYRVWLSEIMLQQTQVATVIPYFQRFITSFPNIIALASAAEDQVLAHWSGLGYYARGRNVHKTARIIAERFSGKFPSNYDDIIALPGIGRSTAAAVCALAFHQHRAILDGNVKRVLTRHCGIEGWVGNKLVEEQLWQQAEVLLPTEDIAIYTQALMDMGATVCKRSNPKCVLCPVQADCVALQSERIAEFPTPRTRRAVPERHATFLLLMYDNDILLEKRPSSGIWGGLWCPPQFDDDKAAKDWFMRSGMQASDGDKLETFTHTFTHFKLNITPLKIQLSRKPLQIAQAGSVWFEVEEALRGAIPTPVRMMLEKLT